MLMIFLSLIPHIPCTRAISELRPLAQKALDLVWSILSRGKGRITPRQFSIRLKKMSLGTLRPIARLRNTPPPPPRTQGALVHASTLISRRPPHGARHHHLPISHIHPNAPPPPDRRTDSYSTTIARVGKLSTPHATVTGWSRGAGAVVVGLHAGRAAANAGGGRGHHVMIRFTGHRAASCKVYIVSPICEL